MIVCNLTKPESTLDQIKKAYPKLPQTDAALVAIALVLSGRDAKAVFEDKSYTWPSDYSNLTSALLGVLKIAQTDAEPAKKTKAALAAAEEEAVEVKIGLTSNYEEGEKILGDREDLKTLFSDILHKGVEFQYSGTDIGWQWSLDRANWSTLSNGELTRRIKLKAAFQGDSVGIEMGTGPKRRTSKKVAEPIAEPEAEVEAEPEAEEA